MLTQNTNILETVTAEIEVSAGGKTEEEALNALFKAIRKKAYDLIDGYMVEMHVAEFYVLDETKKETVKKFLGLFLPVVHEYYEIQAKATVNIKILSFGGGGK